MSKESSFESSTENKKEEWDNAVAKVEKITDKLKKPIDKGIIETVAAFRISNFLTKNSCEGHVDHGLLFSFIDIQAAPIRESSRFKELSEKGIKNMTPDEFTEATELDNRRKEEEKVILSKLESLLEEYREKSDENNHLEIKKYASYYRVQPNGADKFSTKKREYKDDINETEGRNKFLESSRNEMDKFKNFMKERYFEK